MKSLKARVGASIGMGMATITMLMSNALGQASPDPVRIPEPSILPLLGIGLIAALILRLRK